MDSDGQREGTQRIEREGERALKRERERGERVRRTLNHCEPDGPSPRERAARLTLAPRPGPAHPPAAVGAGPAGGAVPDVCIFCIFVTRPLIAASLPRASGWCGPRRRARSLSARDAGRKPLEPRKRKDVQDTFLTRYGEGPPSAHLPLGRGRMCKIRSSQFSISSRVRILSWSRDTGRKPVHRPSGTILLCLDRWRAFFGPLAGARGQRTAYAAQAFITRAP